MSTARNTTLFSVALAMSTAAVALDHASHGVPEPVPVAAPADAPVGVAPCAVGVAPATAPCAVGAPQALAAPPPPPLRRDDEPALLQPPPPPLQRQ